MAGRNSRAVMRALKSYGAGGFGGTPLSTGGMVPQAGVSALMQQQNQWAFQRTYGQLPRDPATFLTGGFGPLEPISPVGIDEPEDDGGLPSPRRWQYPVGWNMPIGVPGSEGLKLTSFANLRLIADSYSILRAGIQVRKEEVLGMEWDIMPTPDAAKAMRADAHAMEDFSKRRAEAVAFFSNPDPNFGSFRAWLNALLEELFVTDAIALHLQPVRGKGKGLLGSDLGALVQIDGSTIRPLLTLSGGVPQPPEPAYQQYLWGVPRVDLTTVVQGEDLSDIKGDLVKEYTANQLLYAPQNTRIWTPYGFPPVERCLIPAMAGLQRQKWQMDYFDEGSIPGLFISPGDPNMTPSQIRELQDSLNALAGDPSWKHKIVVLPGGAEVSPMRPIDLADQYDEIVAVQVLMALDVMPMELGIAPKVSTTQSPGAANQMAKASEDINERKALKPCLIRLKETIFDYVLQQVCGQGDMQWVWEGLETGEDAEGQVQHIIAQINEGLMSIDEGRAELQRAPWGLPITSEPVIVSPTQGTIVPLGSIDTTTGRPKGLPLPGANPAGGKPPEEGSGPNPAKPEPKKPSGGSSGTPAHEAAEAGDDQAQAETGRPEPKPSGKQSASSKAQLAELELVRRRLRKGRSLEDWTPRDLAPAVWSLLTADLTAGADPEGAVAKARRKVAAHERQKKRDAKLAPIEHRITTGLGALANKVRNRAITGSEFMDRGTEVLRTGIHEGMKAGAEQAADDDGLDVPLDKDTPFGRYLWGSANTLAAGNQRYLFGVLEDITAQEPDMGGFDENSLPTGDDGMPADGNNLPIEDDENSPDSPDSLDSRFELYGAQAVAAFETGYLATSVAAAAAGDDDSQRYVIWHTDMSGDPCSLCLDRDGKAYTTDTLPGIPGAGGFGETCMGGPRCRCHVEVVDDAGDAEMGAPGAGVDFPGAAEAMAASLDSGE
ncbi:phage portal protein [Streptomyces sp. NPDC093261]|uniref:phage portal protein n=1 Tax=Streptomyces sp. NPDC093261 TaxID=3366037 RepID=UPI003829B8E9